MCSRIEHMKASVIVVRGRHLHQRSRFSALQLKKCHLFMLVAILGTNILISVILKMLEKRGMWYLNPEYLK
jgi:hypothetical protein